jgi:hypothetical protein
MEDSPSISMDYGLFDLKSRPPRRICKSCAENYVTLRKQRATP